MEHDARPHTLDFCFYYPSGWREWDGTIPISGSAYGLYAHATVDASVRPGEKDYELWLWLLPRIPHLGIERISNLDLDRLRPEFESAMAMEGAPTREELLAAIPRRSWMPKLKEDLSTWIGEFLFLVVVFVVCVGSSVIWLPLYIYKRLRGHSDGQDTRV